MVSRLEIVEECFIEQHRANIHGSNDRHGLYLDVSTLGQCCHLESRPGWLVVLEEVAVDAVDCAELRDVLHQNRGLDDILVSSTRSLQHLANVPKRLLRLSQGAPGHNVPVLVYPELAR